MMQQLVHGDGFDAERAIHGSPEILFFALMISATALGDLIEAPHRRWRPLIYALGVGLLLGTVLASVLYGSSFLHDVLTSQDQRGRPEFQARMFQWSKYLAITFAVFGCLTQILVGLLERRTPLRFAKGGPNGR